MGAGGGTEPDGSGRDPGDPGHSDDPETWRHGTLRTNGVELHYVTLDPDPAAVDHPTGSAPLAVLLHGFPEFWYAWRHQLDPLAAAGYRVVAPDMRGYNRSSQPAGIDSYRPAELVADVRGLIGHFGAPQAAVVGHDWGGLVAWETAIREPDLVERLAVLNAPHPEAYRRLLRRSPGQLARSWYVLALQIPWLPERVVGADDARLVERLLGAARPGSFSECDVARYRAAMARSGPAGPVNYYRAMARETVGAGLRELLPGARTRDATVRVPTMVVWGEQDPALSTRLLDGLGEWVPELRVERLPAATHWVQADEPDRVTALLVDFLS